MLKRYADSYIHFTVGVAFATIMLWFDTHSLVILWGLYLFGYAREQAQIGMKNKIVNDVLIPGTGVYYGYPVHLPHPWKPWQWSAHQHAEALAWAFGGLAVLACG